MQTVYWPVDDYILEMQISTTAETNLDRNDIVDANHSLYCCNQAKLKRIFHKITNKEIKYIRSTADPFFIYVIESDIKAKYYDPQLNIGINFYITLETALNNNLNAKKLFYNGCVKNWYDNGQLKQEKHYQYGKLNGSFKMYHTNGKLRSQCNYKNNKMNGVFKAWFDNEILEQECNYFDGKLHGQYYVWHPNKVLARQINFNNDAIHILYKTWHPNRLPEYDIEFNDDKYHGKYRLL